MTAVFRSAPARARLGLGAVLAATVLLWTGEAAGRLPDWAAAWGGDALCLPLLLSLTLLVHRLAGRMPAWRLPVTHGLAAVAFFAVLFEVLLPAIDARATADPADAAAYLGGWIYFQAVINVPAAAGSAVAAPEPRAT